MYASTSRLAAGEGHLSLTRSSSNASSASFSELCARYPLKLIQTPIKHAPIQCIGVVYMLSYGGGLVSDDSVDLRCSIDSDCTLVLLTQGACVPYHYRLTHTGNTKVYKPSESGKGGRVGQRQHLRVKLDVDAFLVLLPAPVTCFAKASYAQTQRFELDKSASIVLLDWLTSGRQGERWSFARCRTENVVRIGGKTIARDVLLLEDSYQSAVEPYSCYATLILYGSRVKAIIDAFATDWQDRTVRPPARGQTTTQPILWSFCSLEEHGGVVRVAGLETEAVRNWLRDRLRPLEDVLGPDLYRNCWQ